MTEFVLDQETAESEFLKWCDLLELDCEESQMDEDDLLEFGKIKKSFIFAFRKGRLSLTEDDELSLRLKKPIEGNEYLVFPSDFNSSSFVMMDRTKAKESMKKIFSFLGGWAKIDPKSIHNMQAIDTKLCLSIVTLFLS